MVTGRPALAGAPPPDAPLVVNGKPVTYPDQTPVPRSEVFRDEDGNRYFNLNGYRRYIDFKGQAAHYERLAEAAGEPKRRWTENVDGDPPPDLFRRYTMAELLDQDRSVRWLVRGAVMDPTYGQIAGELKTLKTTVGTLLDVAVATGQPFLDRFTVDRSGPVLIYVGEGGQIPFTERLERAAHALDVDPAAMPIETVYDVAPITSSRFEESLARDLAELEPVFFNLDPYYAYHGTKTDSRNLHEEGGLLTSISAPCMAARTSLLITNHFNQTGSGSNLQRITQSGSGEWADSWLLLSHRETPDVSAGKFRLHLEIGSRRWGGTSWDLDLNVGRFDLDRNIHDGPITWNLKRADSAGDRPRDRILAAVHADPGRHAKEALARLAGGKLVDARNLVDAIESEGLIWPQRVPVVRSNGRTDHAWHYFPTSPETEQDA